MITLYYGGELMKQYVFSFRTDGSKQRVWDEVIFANGMMEAFSKAKQAVMKYSKENNGNVHVAYVGVRYSNTDIA
jgi:hypothetical protein